MKNLSEHLPNPRVTPQSQPIPGLESSMVQNAAGGFVFRADDWTRLDRFLILGTEGGTFYAGERELTVENAAVVRRCLHADPVRTVRRIVEVSEGALAPKNDAAILALALAFAVQSPAIVAARNEALRRVCRTGTHLFQFLQAVRGLRGGGRSLNGAVRAWLGSRTPDELGYQMVKYRNRAGWTWRDVLRRYRPKASARNDAGEVVTDPARAALYAWAAGKPPQDGPAMPAVVWAYERATTLSGATLADHIRTARLPWEAVPNEQTTDPAVLGALLGSMPLIATVRHLSKLAAHGALEPAREWIEARLRDEGEIARSRVHPVALMLAAHAYEKGEGRHLTWTPDPRIVDALDDAFQIALKTTEPTSKKLLVAIDTSGSMHGAPSPVPLHKIAAAMTLALIRSDNPNVMAFDVACKALPLSGRMRVTDAHRAIEALGMGGGTDCSLPFRVALDMAAHPQGGIYDGIVVFTDNETWAGTSHPAQMLRKYRETANPKARVVWCAMTASSSDLRMPDDPLTLNVAGFDASVPKLVGDFIAGRF